MSCCIAVYGVAKVHWNAKIKENLFKFSSKWWWSESVSVSFYYLIISSCQSEKDEKILDRNNVIILQHVKIINN